MPTTAYSKDSRVPALRIKHQQSGDVYVLKAKQRGVNKTVTLTYGKTSLISRSDARKKAIQHLALLHQGIHPRQTERDDKLRILTLGDAIEAMLELRPLKPQTVQSYRSTLQRNFNIWLDRPLHSITADECLRRYKAIQVEIETRGRVKAKANRLGECEAQKAIRTLSSVFSFYVSDTLSNGAPLLPNGNPTKLIAKKKVRPSIQRRRDVLSLQQRLQLSTWLEEEYSLLQAGKSCSGITSQQIDYVTLLFCTGLRLNEPLSLTWANVDFEDKVFSIVETKNNQTLILPMTPCTEKLFRRRSIGNASPFVFPSPTLDNKPASMSGVIDRVASQANLNFTAHTLRRTVSTTLAELRCTSSEIGYILNHLPQNQSEEYINLDPFDIKPRLIELEDALFGGFKVEM